MFCPGFQTSALRLSDFFFSVFVFFFPAVVQISAGFHKVKLGERGGRRRDFNDTGVNTRQAMEHVKYSKAGEWSLFQKILIQMLFFDISV